MDYTLKKQLGQHFLHDEAVCQRIVESLSLGVERLIEIGPGGVNEVASTSNRYSIS